ncbi:hypothetical protein [Hydrogenophaga sp.]|uniref:hypothetical protein n=1 Tax=Hydrogenophaga sp. TaxID=1904254 RepID=UPI0027159EC0|nr:hypothetical protein [Hydrogenophaga sp.]MDO9438549.1 hypothetical protein [Hydrogenophaga sp.]
MATKKSTPPVPAEFVMHSHSGNPTTPLRREVARVACFEIEMLSEVLQTYVENHDESGEISPAIRGSLMRLSELSDLIFEAVVAKERDVSDLELVRRIGGRKVLTLSDEVTHG